MTAYPTRQPMTWTARLAWGLLLLAVGAALATWGLTRWDRGAQFLGVAPAAPTDLRTRLVAQAPAFAPVAAAPGESPRVATLEARLAMLERQTQSVQGSAGRADALVIAFAARRAVERGVALGYLEPLLVERFGTNHQRAVATVVTAAHSPLTQAALIADFDRLGPLLRGKAPDEGWWTGAKREFGTLISIRRNDVPNPRPAARYDRARVRLEVGEVDSALAEVMRLPGAAQPEAQAWIGNARRLIAVKRALDEIESAALVGPVRPALGA